jgi:predicted CXXCH cytochrome family protein
VAWGVNSNYIERDGATAYQPTTCSVCHDPHGSPNSKQLRFPINTPDPEQNLCMKCHMRRTEPTFTQSSPHAPQGAMLLGTAGYRPVGFEYAEGRIFSSHATDANPRLCAGCHVNGFTVNDAAGGFVFQATGHLMRPIPCLDAQGMPTGDKTCAYTSAARSWGSCAKSGCHANAGVAASAFNTVRARMKLLADELWIDLNASSSMQASPTDAGMLPTVRLTRPAEWSTTDNRITPAEGAEFNARLCGEYGQANADNSKGIHNPFLCEALLIATINEVRTYYALPAPPAAVQSVLDGPIGGSFSKGIKVSNSQIPGYEIRTAAREK